MTKNTIFSVIGWDIFPQLKVYLELDAVSTTGPNTLSYVSNVWRTLCTILTLCRSWDPLHTHGFYGPQGKSLRAFHVTISKLNFFFPSPKSRILGNIAQKMIVIFLMFVILLNWWGVFMNPTIDLRVKISYTKIFIASNWIRSEATWTQLIS